MHMGLEERKEGIVPKNINDLVAKGQGSDLNRHRLVNNIHLFNIFRVHPINSEFYWYIINSLSFQSWERLQRMRCREHIGKSLPELWVPTIKVFIITIIIVFIIIIFVIISFVIIVSMLKTIIIQRRSLPESWELNNKGFQGNPDWQNFSKPLFSTSRHHKPMF